MSTPIRPLPLQHFLTKVKRGSSDRKRADVQFARKKRYAVTHSGFAMNVVSGSAIQEQLKITFYCGKNRYYKLQNCFYTFTILYNFSHLTYDFIAHFLYTYTILATSFI